MEDLSAAFIRFDNGAALVLKAFWAGNSTVLSYGLFGEKADARKDASGLTIFGEKAGVLTDTVASLLEVNVYDEEIKDLVL